MNFKSLAVSFSVLVLVAAPSHVTGQLADPAAPSTSQARLGELPVRELIGKGITDAHGDNLGEIKDLLVDLTNARVPAGVLDFGGTLGLGEKQYAFPLTELQPGIVPGKFLLNVKRGELASAGSSRAESGDPQRERASKVIGMEVEDVERRKVGNIRDFTVNLDSGLIRNFVIDIENDRAEAVVMPTSLSASVADKLVVNRSRDELIRDAETARRASPAGNYGGRFR